MSRLGASSSSNGISGPLEGVGVAHNQQAFLEAFNQQIGPILDALDNASRHIPALDVKDGINIPRIAVIGDQSAGKSSLIESIFGFSLPRGQDVVTRTPIQVEHRYITPDQTQYATISYSGSGGRHGDIAETVIESWDHIDSHVHIATERIAGKGKNLKDTPIYLKLYSANLPNLTIIDLPGITRVAVDGQPNNIEQIRKELIKKYIESPATVILCCVPANIDLSTAAAIKLAQEVDVNGDRTMGVLTKIDRLEDGVDILGTLEKGERMLKLGFIPVRNRTTKENADERISLAEARERERDFFDNHPILSSLNPRRRGVDSVIYELVRIQGLCMQKELPNLKFKMRNVRNKYAAEIADLETCVVPDENAAAAAASALYNNVVKAIGETANGHFDIVNNKDDLKLSLKVNDLFKDYKNEIETICNPSWFLSDDCFKELEDKKMNFVGSLLEGEVDRSIMRDVFKKHIFSKLEEPSVELVDQVLEVVRNVVNHIVDEICANHRRLGSMMKGIVIPSSLEDSKAKAEEYMGNIIRSERKISTHQTAVEDHMVKIHAVVAKLALGDAAPPAGSGKDEADLRKVMMKMVEAKKDASRYGSDNLFDDQIRLWSYANLVQRRVYDVVCNVIRLFLIDDLTDLADTTSSKASAAATANVTRLFEEMDAVSGGKLAVMNDPDKHRLLQEKMVYKATLDRTLRVLDHCNI